MIGIVFSMLRARRAQAVTLFLLATVAVAAAVAGPVSTRATDAAVVRLEVDNALDRERSIRVSSFANPTDPAVAGRMDGLARLLNLPGFEVVRAGDFGVFGPAADIDEVQDSTARLAFRDRVCEHVTVVSGRCLAGTNEIIIGEQTAKDAGLAPGDIAVVQAYRVSDQPPPPGFGPGEQVNLIPDGPPADLTVVGVYRPADEAEPYWSGRQYFPTNPDGTRGEPIFTAITTLGLVEHTLGSSYLDAYAPPSVLTASRLAGIAAEIDDVTRVASTVGNTQVSSELPDLAQRIATSRELASQLGPVAFIPLTAISLFVIYLAVGYGAFGRRTEIGLVTLRGIGQSRRLLLASAEAVVPIVVGAPVGYVLGHLLVGLVARLRLGSSDGAELSTASLPYAGAALLVALVLALLGQRRILREPVVDLLRGVPRARSAWHVLVVEALILALAVLATVQLRSTSADGLTGLGLLVPGLLIAAVALVAARVNVLATGLVSRAALRRGLLGVGLSAVHLARRPGGHRLFVLLAVGSAMLTFVAAGINLAARAREDRATVAIGAPRVLHLEATNVRRLLTVTHEVDPAGEWAMAAVDIEPTLPGDPTVLALDTQRLAAVATWRPEFGADVAAVAAALAPPGPSSHGFVPPIEFSGDRVEVETEVLTSLFLGGPRPGGQVEVQPLAFEVRFVPLAGGSLVTALVVGLGPGRHTRVAAVRGCEDGCRFAGFRVLNAQPAVQLLVRGVREPGSATDIVPPDQLADSNRWRVSANGSIATSTSSLAIRLQPRGFEPGQVEVAALQAPLPVPVAAAGTLLTLDFNSLDAELFPASPVVQVSMLPRLGPAGVLADMRYLDLTLIREPVLDLAEVWLGPAAPPNAADLFRQAGLAVVDEQTVAATREALARQGPALALQFHLAAAAFGVMLAVGGLFLVAAVDRRSRAADLRALRVQGLRRRMARRAALWGYLSTVVLAGLTGLVGAAVAWAAAGDRIPIFTETSSVLTPPRWPTWASVLQPWALATAATVVGAVVVALALRRAVARPNADGGAR